MKVFGTEWYGTVRYGVAWHGIHTPYMATGIFITSSGSIKPLPRFALLHFKVSRNTYDGRLMDEQFKISDQTGFS